ncbi:hypothetical protein IT417_01435 [bacterium]|nr:hypothetical protein [bacterium]
MASISGNDGSDSVPPVGAPLSVNPPSNVPVTPAPNPVTDTPEDLDIRWTRRMCTVCNYTYEGKDTLVKCPKCGNEDLDKFVDVD